MHHCNGNSSFQKHAEDLQGCVDAMVSTTSNVPHDRCTVLCLLFLEEVDAFASVILNYQKKYETKQHLIHLGLGLLLALNREAGFPLWAVFVVGAKRGVVGCGTAAQLPVSLIQMSWGEGC